MLAQFTCHKMIGASHIRHQKPCQDAVGFTQIDDTLAMVIADGHGSSPHSDIGSRLAVQTCLGKLLEFAEMFSDERFSLSQAEQFAKHPLRSHIVRAWKEAVQRISSEDCNFLDYGTTLLFVLSTPRFLLLGQLGDGDILLTQEDGLVLNPMPLEELNFGTTTVSLCMDTAEHLLHTKLLPPPAQETLLMLATDGYSDSYAQQSHFEKVATDYLELVRKNGLHFVSEKIPSFLKMVSEQGSGDDISLGLIYWESPAIPLNISDIQAEKIDTLEQENSEVKELIEDEHKPIITLNTSEEMPNPSLLEDDEITEEVTPRNPKEIL